MIPKFEINELVAVRINDNQYKISRINLLFIDVNLKSIRYKLQDDDRLYLENQIITYCEFCNKYDIN